MATYGYALTEAQHRRMREVLATVPGGGGSIGGTGQGRQPGLIQCGSLVGGPGGQAWFHGLVVWVDGGAVANFSEGMKNVWLCGVNPAGAGVILGEGEFYNAVCVGVADIGGDERPVYACGVPCDWNCTEILTGDGLMYMSGHQCVTEFDYCETMGGESSSSSGSDESSSSSSARYYYYLLDRLTAAELHTEGCTTYLTTTNTPLVITTTAGGVVVQIAESSEPEYATTSISNCWENCCDESSSSSSWWDYSSSSSSVPSVFACGCFVPETVYVTWGGALSSQGTVPLVYSDEFGGGWYADTTDPENPCGGNIELTCSEGVWTLAAFTTFTDEAVASCDPFSLSFSATNEGEVCNGAATATVSETE